MGSFRQWLELNEATDFHNRAGADFWGNVGAGVLPIATDTGEWLVGMRSDLVNEPGQWGVLGGKIDDEDVMDIQGEAEREFEEETGYRGPIRLTPAYVYKTRETDSHGIPNFAYHNFIGEIERGNWEPNPDEETDDFAWVTYEQLLKLRPMHFGLRALIQNSGGIIKSLSQKHMPTWGKVGRGQQEEDDEGGSQAVRRLPRKATGIGEL